MRENIGGCGVGHRNTGFSASAPTRGPGYYSKMNENILVVDDDPQMRELLDRALSKEGYSVFLSGNGAE
ncbi:MAG: hypothetical protein O2910_05450, partial [Proteobacteria bacterium]|nr:hypothetical protein [Pseudomonadota bacterium]